MDRLTLNNRPIEEAKDADLRSSIVAMRRAALRAREIAERTGTALVISRNGVIEYLHPRAGRIPGDVQEPAAKVDKTP
jgi:hypothetical protein